METTTFSRLILISTSIIALASSASANTSADKPALPTQAQQCRASLSSAPTPTATEFESTIDSIARQHMQIQRMQDDKQKSTFMHLLYRRQHGLAKELGENFWRALEARIRILSERDKPKVEEEKAQELVARKKQEKAIFRWQEFTELKELSKAGVYEVTSLGEKTVIAKTEAGALIFFDIQKNKIVNQVKLRKQMRTSSLLSTPDGQFVILADVSSSEYRGRIFIFDVAKNDFVNEETIPQLGVHAYTDDLSISPNGKYLFSWDAKEGRLSVLRLTDRQWVFKGSVRSNFMHPAGLVHSPDGRWVYAPSAKTVIDLGKGKKIDLEQHPRLTAQLSDGGVFLSDSSSLLLSLESGETLVFDLIHRKRIAHALRGPKLLDSAKDRKVIFGFAPVPNGQNSRPQYRFEAFDAATGSQIEIASAPGPSDHFDGLPMLTHHSGARYMQSRNRDGLSKQYVFDERDMGFSEVAPNLDYDWSPELLLDDGRALLVRRDQKYYLIR